MPLIVIDKQLESLKRQTRETPPRPVYAGMAWEGIALVCMLVMLLWVLPWMVTLLDWRR